MIKHRGKEINTRSKTAITLTQAVHTQVVGQTINGISLSIQLIEQIGHAFETSLDSGQDLIDSLETLVDLPQNTSSRLTAIIVQSVYLRRAAELILNSKASETEILELLNQVTQLDQTLTAWAISVPPEWKFTATDKFELPKTVPRETFIYEDRVDVYEDLFVAGHWNSYRVNRIHVLSIACDCVDALPQLPTTLLKVCIYRVVLTCSGLYKDPYPENTILTELSLQSRKELAYVAMQKLADDICGSVPFFLGTKMCAGTDDNPCVEYPYKTFKATKAHRRSAAGSGGYNLVEPFHEPLKCVLGVRCLRAGQKEWILSQFARIGKLYSMEPSALVTLSSAKPVPQLELRT